MALSSPIDRFRAAADVTTPARMVVLLYERLHRDIAEAEAALTEGDRYQAHRALLHAQEIVAELDGALNPEAWPEAVRLSDLYRFVSGRLVDANLSQDPTPLRDCRTVIEPLLEAWRAAWQQESTPAAPVTTTPNRSRAPLDIAG